MATASPKSAYDDDVAHLFRRTPKADDGRHRIRAWNFRSETKPTAIALVVITFLAWVASFFLFAFLTDAGLAQLAARGFLGMFGGWLLTSALIAAGYGLGYLVLRKFARGTRQFALNEVPWLALGDAVLASFGGYFVGFLPLSLADDPYLLFTWVIVVGALFGFVVLNPRYIANWRAAETAGLD